MAGSARSTADKEMAAHLKKRGEERTHMRCPMCHKVIGSGQPGVAGMNALGRVLYAHLSSHVGGEQ